MKPTETTKLIRALDNLQVVAEDSSEEALIEKLKAIFKADSVFIGAERIIVTRGCLSRHLKRRDRKRT